MLIRDVTAAIVVWRALRRARKRNLDFLTSEAVVMAQDGTVAFGLFSDDTVQVDSAESARSRWAQSSHATKVLKTGSSTEWALVARRLGPSRRFKHRWPQLTSISCESLAEVRSRTLKKKLDEAAKQLVGVVEIGARRRVETIETLWAIDGQNSPRFERAVAVRFLGAKTRKKLKSMEKNNSCPGGFCDLREPLNREGDKSCIARNAIGAACREARTGEALDFWPESLVLWCLRKAPREPNKSGSTPCSTSWTLPNLGISFPCRTYSIFRPSQTIRICWVWRGPAARFVNVDLLIVLPEDGNATDLNIGDELLLTERFVASSVSESYVDWEIPADVNGTCSSVVEWRLRVTEAEPVAPGYPLAVALSDVFRIDKNFSPLEIRGSLSPPPLKTLAKSKSAELVAKTKRQSIVDERQVRRWDQVKVCPVCAQVYAELSRHREAWLIEKQHNIKQTQFLNREQADSCHRLAKRALHKKEALPPLLKNFARRTRPVDSEDSEVSRPRQLREQRGFTYNRDAQQHSFLRVKEDHSLGKQPAPISFWGAALADDADEDEEQATMEEEDGETPLEVIHNAARRNRRVERRRRRHQRGGGDHVARKLNSYDRLLSEKRTIKHDVASQRVRFPTLSRAR